MKKNSINLIILITTGLIAGALLGITAGKAALQDSFRGRVSTASVLFMPSGEYIKTVKLLNSDNPLDRLTGYYAYYDNNLIDFDFLYENYRKENSVIIKKTIVWIAGLTRETEALVDFYSRIYDSSPDIIQQKILISIEKNSREKYIEFLKNHQINNRKTGDLK